MRGKKDISFISLKAALYHLLHVRATIFETISVYSRTPTMPTYEVTTTSCGVHERMKYHLVIFDKQGNERGEADRTQMSENLRRYLTESEPRFTDVFILSHGWNGDAGGAKEQYTAWIQVMAEMKLDRERAAKGIEGFRPLIIGLHWPSLLWGDEDIPPGAIDLLPRDESSSTEHEVDAYAERLVDTPKARSALRTIIESAQNAMNTTNLPIDVKSAYETLRSECKLEKQDPRDRPGADLPFDPQAIINDIKAAQNNSLTMFPEQKLLGTGKPLHLTNDIWKWPLRSLSFWAMRSRACKFGESGGNKLLRDLQTVAPTARFHLMGHSFGCIVVSAMLAGRPDQMVFTRPVHSLFLVQGALSIWSYAHRVPWTWSMPGYFHRILDRELVEGPILTTRSAHDRALHFFYPLGTLPLKKNFFLPWPHIPRYGAIGAYGIHGSSRAIELQMGSDAYDYAFKACQIYNLDATNVIRKSSGLLSGAHNDIAHREVAHAFWAAASTKSIVKSKSLVQRIVSSSLQIALSRRVTRL